MLSNTFSIYARISRFLEQAGMHYEINFDLDDTAQSTVSQPKVATFLHPSEIETQLSSVNGEIRPEHRRHLVRLSLEHEQPGR